MSLSTNELSLLSDAIVSTLDANNIKFSLYSNYSGRFMWDIVTGKQIGRAHV